ncbi:hypothetical protein [Nioella nitratireducens]|uniref:hypothetical protein n=1 Tax=Nioella nitratireducens TaxID=1287720 RepID=UPI0008FD43E5|nr:hypothetical protein [Nioella nitratireducens]
MKSIVLATAVVASLAAPAFASEQLAQSVGVQPGQYTTAELIRLEDAIQRNDHQTIAFIMNGGGNPTDPSVAYNARLRQAVEDQDPQMVAFLQNSGTEVISSQGRGENPVAQQIFARIAAESAEND